tara:strand:+ start:2578 stop:2997 length:420 start_codon:yes stop_codon:yes gene_type:complete
MPRIKLPIPKQKHFSTTMFLRIYDMNYGGHMGNDSVLSIVHEARVQFLNYLGVSEKNFYGSGLLMADSAIIYKKEAFYGEQINIEITVSDLNKYGFDLFYLICNAANKEIARVKTGLVCYNHNMKKLVKLPDVFYSQFC